MHGETEAIQQQKKSSARCQERQQQPIGDSQENFPDDKVLEGKSPHQDIQHRIMTEATIAKKKEEEQDIGEQQNSNKPIQRVN